MPLCVCRCIGCTSGQADVYLSHGENDVFESFRCLPENMCSSGGFWVGSRAAIRLDYGAVILNFTSTSTKHW